MNENEPLLQSSSSFGPSAFTKVIVQEQKLEHQIKSAYSKFIRMIYARDFLAELLATFILVTIGNGAIAQYKLSHKENGTFLTVNIGYGVGLMIGAYIAGGVTGAHMNPAVTLGMALRGKTKWIKVMPYWIAQYLGAFLSSAVVYGLYFNAIHHFTDNMKESDPNYLVCFETSNGTNVSNVKLPLCTGGIFATYPATHLTLVSGFFDQVFGTFLLVLGIFAICDSKNSEVKAGLKPLMIGFLLWGIGLSFGFNCGYAVNPARDFAPRLFTAMAGYGKDVFICSQCPFTHWWWVPLIAPMIGAVIAAPLYWFMIEANHPETPGDEDDIGTVQGKRTFTPQEDNL